MWLYRTFDEETDERYGKEPEKRSFEELLKTGIIILDKHIGPTSHQITSEIKKLFNLKKCGHIGTLDPNASGVLPILLERSTRLAPLFFGLDKEYVGIMHLHKDVDKDFLNDFITKNFIGELIQVPPRKSAVARKPRKRKVYEFELIEKENRDVLFRVICQAGFYVRKYVHDIGLKLKIGAHLTELRRISIGLYNEEKKEYKKIFSEEEAVTFTKIHDLYVTNQKNELKKFIKPAEYCLLHVKKIFVKDSAIYPITQGSPLFVSGITRVQEDIKKNDVVAIFSLKNELIAFGYAKMDAEEMVKEKKGKAVRIERVFIEKNVYPKML